MQCVHINRLKTFGKTIITFFSSFVYRRFMHRMITIQRILDDIQQENRRMEMNQCITWEMDKMVHHGYHHHHHPLISQMSMERLLMLVEYVYHQWLVFDLNRERCITIMAMNKQYKPEKHLAKHCNLYEMDIRSVKETILFFL